MERNVRYQRLSSEEDQTVVPTPAMSNPIIPESGAEMTPEVSTSASFEVEPHEDEDATAVPLNQETSEIPTMTIEPPKYDPMAPPSYVVATELPTYDQVQQMKMEEPTQENVALDIEALERGDALLGTDFMFLCSFFVSFLFNWIGFLMLMCFCPTIAGRYGALAGFGLSLAKWTLIVKHSTDLISTENNWLWWLILAFGILICVRAVLQYLQVKREWHLLTRVNQQRLMYFY